MNHSVALGTLLERVAALDAASGMRQALSGSRRIDELAERLLSHIGALFQYRFPAGRGLRGHSAS